MWLCRKCSTEVPHECAPVAVLGRPVSPCPLKGSVWVHVVDYGGVGVEGATVKVDNVEKVTNNKGFAVYDPLETGPRKTEIVNKFEDKLKQFYLPETASIEAAVTPGQLSMIEFQIPAWIEVRVEDDKGVVVTDVSVTVKDSGGSRVEVLTKDKLNEAGIYRIDKLYPGECEISFPDLCDDDWAAK